MPGAFNQDRIPSISFGPKNRKGLLWLGFRQVSSKHRLENHCCCFNAAKKGQTTFGHGLSPLLISHLPLCHPRFVSSLVTFQDGWLFSWARVLISRQFLPHYARTGERATDRWVILVIWPDGENHFPRDSCTHRKIKIKRKTQATKCIIWTESADCLIILTRRRNKLKELGKKKKIQIWIRTWSKTCILRGTDFNDGNNQRKHCLIG